MLIYVCLNYKFFGYEPGGREFDKLAGLPIWTRALCAADRPSAMDGTSLSLRARKLNQIAKA